MSKEELRENQILELEQVEGIGRVTAERLIDKQVTSERLAGMRPEEIAEMLKISQTKAKQIVISAKGIQFGKLEFYTGQTYKEWDEENVIWYTTGSKALNNILGGGIRTMRSYGLGGPASVGKSQIIFYLTAEVLKAGGIVLFIETETGTFAYDRLEEIGGKDLPLENIYLQPATKIGNSYMQRMAYEFLRYKARERKANVKLIAVDSFTAKIRDEFTGRDMWPLRSAEMSRHISYLEDMTKEFNAALVMSCQVGQAPDVKLQHKVQMRFGTVYYPYGGSVLEHRVNYWLSLNQIRTDLYEAVLWDSSNKKRDKCTFGIVGSGIIDASK